MKKILLSALAGLFSFGAFAQVTGLVYETRIVHDAADITNTVGEVFNLDGYTTYDLYATVTTPGDATTDPVGDLVTSISALDGDSVMSITTTGDWFFAQSIAYPTIEPYGSATPPQNSMLFPELEFTTYFTINDQDSQSPNYEWFDQDPGTSLFDWVQPDGQFLGNEVALLQFSLPVNQMGYSGADDRVWLGQYTTNGDINWRLNVNSIQPMFDGSGNIEFEGRFSASTDPTVVFGCTDPMADNYLATATEDDQSCVLPCAMQITNVMQEQIPCGESSGGSLTFDDEGGQGLTRSYFREDNFSSEALWENIGSNTITFYAYDNVGCVDSITLEWVNSNMTWESEILSEPACFGDETGSFQANVIGNAGDVTYALDPNFENVVTETTFSDLGGECVIIYAEDGSGCEVNTTVCIEEPGEFNYVFSQLNPTSCAGTDDGDVFLNNIAGNGVAPFTATITDNDSGETIYENEVLTGASMTLFQQGLAEGSYSIVVVDANGCTNEASNINVTGPPPFVVEQTVTDISCFGEVDGSFDISATGGNGGTNVTFEDLVSFDVLTVEDLAADTYTVIVEDNMACTEEVMITIEEPELFEASASGVDPLCFEDANGMVVISTEGGTGEATFDPIEVDNLPAGTYTYTVTDANGCTTTVEETLVDPAQLTENSAAIVTDVSVTGASDGSIEVDIDGGTGMLTYAWTDENGTLLSITNPGEGFPEGEITLVATDENGCEYTSTYNVIIGVEELFASEDFTLMPNPSTGVFVLNISGLNSAVAYTVTDAQGRIVANETIEATGGEVREEIDLTNASNGMYFMTLQKGSQTASVKLIKND